MISTAIDFSAQRQAFRHRSIGGASKRVSAEIIAFPAPPAKPEPLPTMDIWLDELDAEGAFPHQLKAKMMLARCPEPDHPSARWLAEYVG